MPLLLRYLAHRGLTKSLRWQNSLAAGAPQLTGEDATRFLHASTR